MLNHNHRLGSKPEGLSEYLRDIDANLESVNATQMYLNFSCMDSIGPLNSAVFCTDEFIDTILNHNFVNQ